MSDRRPLPGLLPPAGRDRRATIRPLVALRTRRHVDLCRTSAAMCRA